MVSALLIGIAAWGCNSFSSSSGFSGNSGTTHTTDHANANSNATSDGNHTDSGNNNNGGAGSGSADGTPGGNTGTGGDQGGGTTGSGSDSGQGNIGSGGDNANRTTDQIQQCLAKKAGQYNIILIFDNSGSQRITDPTFVRRDGALNFIDQMAAFTAKYPHVKVYIDVLSFNTRSIRAAQGWTLIGNGSTDAIKNMIRTATANPEGGTAYSPVLKDAAAYFKQIGALPNAAQQRNFVVFLTDGLPNILDPVQRIFAMGIETAADIPKAVNDLVQTYGAAIIAGATGNDIPAQGEQTVASMALPKTGIKFPDHTGLYFRARTPDELKAGWVNIFSKIGTCTPQP